MSARAKLEPRSLDPADLEQLVCTIKGLAMDAVQKANSGHPGMPMGTAAMASTLWTRFMVHDPADPDWVDRDRFVLSAGHGSMLLYSLLHLTGYALSLDELKNFRQLDSKTPGHPEVHDTPGVEVTTGPLGSGLAAGVGMALAERFLGARYNKDGHTIVDHFTYGIAGDGCLMEGIAAEACSFAGHQKLGKLIFLYDDNQITIDGGTEISFTEDVKGRFEAYGWQVIKCDGHDAQAVAQALSQARAELNKPTLICARTVIAQGAPTKAGTSSAHGAPLGVDEIAATKKGMNWPVEPTFHIPEGLTAKVSAALEGGLRERKAWDVAMAAYRKAYPELAQEFDTVMRDELPPGVFDALPTFEVGTKIATRKACAKTMEALFASHPTLLGGSADLAGSNGIATPEGGSASADNPGGRNIHFGVREHGMAGICNGIALHGGVRPYDATFLIFSDFMRGALRLSALMELPVVHVLSHDSVFLGEDGPTHQPIEQAMSLRLIPNLNVVRPADANETVGAWVMALHRKHHDGPTALLTTRQGLPVLEGSRRDISQGGYVLWEPKGATAATLDGILVATGSEVSLALDAAKQLHSQGKVVRVVSLPCWEAFDEQDQSYRDSVLPPAVTRRLSIEAGVTLGWARYAAHSIGIDRFGASAPIADLVHLFGFSTEAVAARFLELD